MSVYLERDELITLIQQLIDRDCSDDDVGVLARRFNEGIPHPAGTNLIFFPTKSGLPDNLSAEEIADIALSYVPLELPASASV